jgi:hypothetical protein
VNESPPTSALLVSEIVMGNTLIVMEFVIPVGAPSITSVAVTTIPLAACRPVTVI